MIHGMVDAPLRWLPDVVHVFRRCRTMKKPQKQVTESQIIVIVCVIFGALVFASVMFVGHRDKKMFTLAATPISTGIMFNHMNGIVPGSARVTGTRNGDRDTGSGVFCQGIQRQLRTPAFRRS
jgi:hypothetical protein